MEGDLAALRTLRAGLVAAGHRALVWWVDALRSELLIGELDPLGADVARTALADVPDDDDLPLTIELYARARLRRAAAAHDILAMVDEDSEVGRRLREQAIVDFLRAGFGGEAVMTSALVAAGEALMRARDVEVNLARLVDARALLRDQGSVWPLIVDHLLALVAVAAGERDVFRSARARLSASGGEAPFGPLSHVVTAVVTAADRPDDRSLPVVMRAIDRIGAHHLRWRWSTQLLAAEWLARAGRSDALQHATVALDAPMITPIGEPWRLLRRWTTGIRSGTGAVPGGEDLVSALDALAAQGWRGLAEQLADELIHELDEGPGGNSPGSGDPGPLVALRTWRNQKVGGAGNRPRYDERPTAPVSTSPAGVITINVLCPALEIAVDGLPAPVGVTVARLIAGLVAAGPAPRHVEQVADWLWPGLPLPAARSRLNALVYRLRKQHASLGASLKRNGELIELDTGRCRIDLVEYRLRSGAGGSQRLGALASVRGNLCHAQLAYDEHLVDARRSFAAEWLALAAEAITEPGARTRLAPAAAALEVGQDLAELAGGAR